LNSSFPAIVGTGLGAGLAFYGVSRTNKHNARENAANRQHQLDVEVAKAKIAAEYRRRDNRWAFRKDIYVDLLTATTDLRGILTRLATFSAIHRSESPDEVAAKLQPLLEEQRSAIKRFSSATVQAPLAMADDILALVNEAMGILPRLVDLRSPDGAGFLDRLSDTMGALQAKLQAAGRKDLWGTPGDEANA
jgi:hypothetical protein